MTATEIGSGDSRRLRFEWLSEVQRVDRAAYAAVTDTDTPSLDRALQRLSNAADNSKLWVVSAAALSLVGGAAGRRAAVQGLASVGVASVLVNIVGKALGGRPRPARPQDHVASAHVAMPGSSSFPSGHAASGFAFATGVASRLPLTALPLHAAAGVVAYSRVATGVHYPGDVLVGAMLGTVIGQLTTRSVKRLFGWL
jgi:membrane-associated phospholipid phosphatase